MPAISNQPIWRGIYLIRYNSRKFVAVAPFALYIPSMNDAHMNGAVAGTSPGVNRRTPLLVLIVPLLVFSGAFFPPPHACAAQAKPSVSKSAPARPSAQKTSPKKGRATHNVRALRPAEDLAALRDRGFSSGFGVRAVSKKRIRFHKGVDIPAPKGSDIMAFNDGVVTFTGVKNGYGKTVVVQQIDGRDALYAHMSSYVVKVGDAIKRGDHIGHVGRTGRATGFHLHFELIDEGRCIDPAEHVWYGAELVLGPDDLNLASQPETSVAQPNHVPASPIH